jgi:uncharacterized protein YfaP (DUF2135 family)
MDVTADIRMVINWNMDNVVIWPFIDNPNHYRYHNCYVCGGRYYHDYFDSPLKVFNRSGYGPSQFLIKKARKIKYKFHVNYFRISEFATSEPTIVMAEIYTNYADKTEQRKVVSLQITENWKDRNVLVGEIKF